MHNIYDANSKTYIFKLTKSGVKENLLLESGVRFHLLSNYPEKNDRPSGFAMKLRKHLRGLFFDSIEQIGVERIVKLKFCGADKANLDFTCYIVLELYAKGNIVLLDGHGTAISVLRTHVYDENNRVAAKEKYPWELSAKFYFENISANISNVESFLKEGEKITNSALISKLVPCAHQGLIDIFC